MPNVIQSPVNKYFATNDPRSIVFHTTLGTSARSSIEWLQRPQIEASYHYIIDDNGDIYHLVNLNKGAWGAGRYNQPNLRAQTFFKADRVNQNTVHIAFSRKGHPTLTKEQVASGVWLVKYVGQQTGYRYTADNTFAHKEIAIDKPQEVLTYRQQILDELVGEKDEKDSEERARLTLLVQYLQLKLQLLLAKQKYHA